MEENSLDLKFNLLQIQTQINEVQFIFLQRRFHIRKENKSALYERQN